MNEPLPELDSTWMVCQGTVIEKRCFVTKILTTESRTLGGIAAGETGRELLLLLTLPLPLSAARVSTEALLPRCRPRTPRATAAAAAVAGRKRPLARGEGAAAERPAAAATPAACRRPGPPAPRAACNTHRPQQRTDDVP